ncbi:MAG: HDOD domain-containing protein [Planctomycetes bacterium]|nr:HDOD domain-containing protein [Planctomycetota bacterium]
MNQDSSDIDDGRSTAVENQPILVGRQPIFDRELEVFAYELLYRGHQQSDAADFRDGDRATAQVLASTFVEIGIDVVTGGKPAFVNLTRGAITEQVVHLFPTDRIIAEILENIDADENTLEHVRELKDAGYTIVLDDFVLRDEVLDFIALADIVKLDIREMSRADFVDHFQRLRALGKRMLAEKIETHEEYQLCHDLGFDYFQGYFLCRPQVIAGRTERQGHVGILDLIAALNDRDSTVEQLERAISQDAQLSYQLMKYINSAAFALSAQVTSVHHALVLLGRRLVTVWANMIVLTGFDTKPTELLTTAMLRARMAESIAQRRGMQNCDVYFTAGLFSLLDAIFDEPMDQLLARLPLAPELVDALNEKKGDVGMVLDHVIHYDRGDWAGLDQKIDSAILQAAYFDALRWVARVLEI